MASARLPAPEQKSSSTAGGLCLLDLPTEVHGGIAAQLGKRDKVRLAAACRPLRAASVHWFRCDVFKLDTCDALPDHAVRLRRVQAPVEVVAYDLNLLGSLTGLHAVLLDMSLCDLQQVPAQLAGLAQLSGIVLGSSPIQGGWQHLPRQLQQLHLNGCDLTQVPAELAHLMQLEELELRGNSIQDGWQHMPQGCRRTT